MKHLIRLILRALYKSRLHKALKVIRDHRHLFRTPEHVATFKKAIREKEPGKTADGGAENHRGSAAVATAAPSQLRCGVASGN